MLQAFIPVQQGVLSGIAHWETILSNLSEEQVCIPRNNQHRNIKQILGHMVDSATNNTHRVVHLQYQPSPFEFPNYATEGNNDRWIAIQDYEHENWKELVQLWKSVNLHFVLVISVVQQDKLQQKWNAAPGVPVSLEEMVVDYLRHFNLHLDEIGALMKAV